MKKKKIVMLLGCFAIGGAENMVYEVVKNLDKQRFDVHVLCTASKLHNDLEARVEQVCPVTYLGETDHIGPRALLRVMKALSSLKPSVVHAHLGGAGFGAPWALLHRKPLVITVHSAPEKAFTGKIEKLVRLALRFGKTRLVAVSEENAVKMKQYFALTPEKGACVNNGIDVTRFFRKEHEGFTLINVARHDENKNQAALIRCFARLHEQVPGAKLLLLGDGPTHRDLIEQVKQAGLTEAVVFTGNVSNTQDYYAISDLYVQTSHREAMPLSVLEAMAAGLPIVSTDVGGLSDVVQDNGALVQDHDEDALYRQIERIYKQSEAQTRTMCDASKRLVQAYSSEGMTRAYEKIYAG